MNLIITCARNLEYETKEEIEKILETLGDEKPTIKILKMPGILTVTTKLDPLDIVKQIYQQLVDEPWSIRYCLRVIPIQRNTETEIESIEKEVSELVDNIKEDETYRISIEKRNSDISSADIISKIAKKIQNKVSLEKPDKIILIEILGNIAGISLLEKDNILSVEKIKRSFSEQD